MRIPFLQKRLRPKDATQKSLPINHTQTIPEAMEANPQASWRAVVPEFLELTHVISELSGIPAVDPLSIKLINEGVGDLMMGEKYLETCLLLRQLQGSRCNTPRDEVLCDLECAKANFAYDKCYEELSDQRVRRFDHDSAELKVGNRPYKLTMLGWIGAICRRGTSSERTVLQEHLNKYLQQDFSVAASGVRSATRTDYEDSSVQHDEHKHDEQQQKESVLQTPVDDGGGVLLEVETTPLSTAAQAEVPGARNESSTMGRFTSALWEYASGEGGIPTYTEVTISSYPPQFEMTVEFQGRSVSRRARTKKMAKHLASQVMCEMLQLQVS